jgi:cation transport ATPase
LSIIEDCFGVIVEKREVRIPALEAAEANKRLEEKRRNERELQKAAMKAEREKLNQEKVLKKKQEEEQKKKEAGMADKKRQREEREKKEKEKDKEKKRKFTEMDHQIQREEPTKKEPPKRARVAREKELQQNVIVSLELLFYLFIFLSICIYWLPLAIERKDFAVSTICMAC